MPSPLTLKIAMPDYLKRFLIKIYSEDGTEPITFPKKDNYNKMLAFLLERPQRNTPEDVTGPFIEIQLPYLMDVNVLYNFHMSEFNQQIFVGRVDDRFKLRFREYIDKALLAGFKMIDAVRLFIDEYELDESTIDMLNKDIQRYYSLKAKNNKNNKKKVVI